MTELRTAAEVMDALGGDRSVGDITGRSRKATNNWRHFGRFPSDTYVVMQGALKKIGHTAPASLWRMANCDAA